MRRWLTMSGIVLTTAVVTVSLMASARRSRRYYGEFETLATMIQKIREQYVEEVDIKKLLEGAARGVVMELDLYSQYLSPDFAKELEIDTSGEFGGLGIEITLDRHQRLTVVTPLEGTPAFKAGVRAGDIIIKIDGQSTEGITLMQAVKKLRGPRGTKVTITVLHEGESDPVDITIVRDIIRIKSVASAWFVSLEPKIGYLRLSQFQKRTIEELDQTIDRFKSEGMQALVLDLRYNPGGLLDTAVDVADRFVKEGVIVSTRGRAPGTEQVYRAGKLKVYGEFPMCVLISRRSASASEIVAGALQDHKRAVIIGERSFGKGSVQTIIPLPPEGALLKLTTAYYYTPSGRLIHRVEKKEKPYGIEPDILIPMNLEQERKMLEAWNKERILHEGKEKKQHYIDPQLQRAVDVLSEMLGSSG